MTKSPNYTVQMGLDFEGLPNETIDLSPAVFDQALRLSALIPNEEQQWRAYLNALALGGFEEWLGSRITNLSLNTKQCTLLQPAMANAIDAVSNLQVGEFKLCLITMGSLTDIEVSLPRAVVDLPEYRAHFYVLIEVQEEQGTATIQGFFSYEQWVNQHHHLEAEDDWTYPIPLSWFEDDSDRLLLNLRCLAPTAISLPESVNNRSMQLVQMRSQLESVLPELHNQNRQLWQVLTWEQGAIVLTNPDLLNWLYQWQQQPEQTTMKKHLTDTLQLLTQPAVNAGRWLLGELDELAQELSWILLPSLTPATALRSPVEEFEAIVMQLRQTNVEIPLESRGAYRDLRLAGMPLRLYAVTWPLLSGTIPEWTLLLVIGATPGTHLPSDLQVRISDCTGILVERVLETQQQNSYFFTRVVGTWDEKFVVTVSLPSGIAQILPPFSFNPTE